MKRVLSVILMVSLILGNTITVSANTTFVSGSEIKEELIMENDKEIVSDVIAIKTVTDSTVDEEVLDSEKTVEEETVEDEKPAEEETTEDEDTVEKETAEDEDTVEEDTTEDGKNSEEETTENDDISEKKTAQDEKNSEEETTENEGVAEEDTENGESLSDNMTDNMSNEESEQTATVSENEIAKEEKTNVREIPIAKYSTALPASTEIVRPAASWSLEGLGAPAVVTDGTTHWNGPIVVLGEEAEISNTYYSTNRKTYSTHWRLVDADKALVMSDGIFINYRSILYGGKVWEETPLYTYLNKDFKESELFQGKSINVIAGDIRIPTLDEIRNPTYGYYNSTDASYTRLYGTKYAVMPNDGMGEPYYVKMEDGSITSQEPEGGNCGFVPTMQLDTSKIYLAMEESAAINSFGALRNAKSNIYQLFLKTESDFDAELPTEGNWGSSIKFNVKTSGGEGYNRLYAVLSTKTDNKIVAAGVVSYEASVGEKEIKLRSDISPGRYVLTVFEVNSEFADTSICAGTPVSTDFEIKGTEVENFKVSSQNYGSVNLSWQLGNIQENNLGGDTYCNIYRSESEDGEYELLVQNYHCSNSRDSHFYTDEKDVLALNGSNKILYYKICVVLYDGMELEYAWYTTNKDVNYGEAGRKYAGMYFAEVKDGTEQNFSKVEALTLRPGEYKELQVVLYDEEGNLVTDSLAPEDEWYNDNTSWVICKQPAKDSYNAERVSENLLSIVPISFRDVIHVGIAAYDKVEADQVYYLMAERNTPSWEKYLVQIPIYIVAPQEGDAINKMPDGRNGIYLTSESLSAAIRADMVARKAKGTYYVKEDAYLDWMAEGDAKAVYDFSREREGMKPDEGDYLFWQNFDPEKNMDFVDGQWIHSYTSFNGSSWCVIESNQVYFTTRAQEDAVDAKIKEILTTGGLSSIYSQYYSEDGEYTTQVRKIIADACCDYVYKNTSYIGTPVPKYHSAWSAIINRTGTCQAYSLYLTRLLREFGIANKILTGTDKNYHTYNIVQIDKENDLWYYYDATGGIKYKTEQEFKRTQYQGLFLEDPMFIANYISKIAGSSYSPTVYLYADETLTGKYFSVQSAAEELVRHNSQDENKDARYKIKLMGNADFGNGNMILPETVAYCELDLNGYKLTIDDIYPARVGLDKIHNGTIYLTVSGNLFIYTPENHAKEVICENVTIECEQGVGMVHMWAEEYNQEAFSENGEDKTQAEIFFKNVQIPNTSGIEVRGLVHMDEKTSVNAFSVSLVNTNYEKPSSLLGTINTYDLWQVIGHFNIGNLSIASDEEYLPLEESTVFNIYGDVSWKKIKLLGTDPDVSVHTVINLMEVTDAKGNVKTGSITFGGEILPLHVADVVLGLNKQKVTIDNEGNKTEPENIKFESGETVAVVTKAETVIPTYRFVMMGAEEDEQLIRKGNKLIAARVSVKVSHTNTQTGENIEKEYISLEDAAASLKVDFAQDAGSYDVILLDNAKLNSNVTFPAFVKELHMKAVGKKDTNALVTLDLGGYNISTEAIVNVYNNLHITNTSEAASKFVTTAKNGVQGYAVKILQAESPNVKHVSGITLSAANGTILFAGEKEDEVISQLHIADAAISAKEVNVVSGKWKLGTVSAANIMNDAQAYITKINNVTNLYNKEGKVLVVDEYTQNTKGTTELEKDSVLVIKNSAVVYNTVIGTSETGSENKNAYIYSIVDDVNGAGKATSVSGSIALEGKVTAADNKAKLLFSALKDEATVLELLNGIETLDETAITELAPRTKIFITGIKNFPVELMEVNSGIKNSSYKEVYQQDKDICVGREWISIYTKQVNGSEEFIKSFIRWSDAAAYLDTLYNTQMEYVVEFSEDVEMTTALTLPTKVKGITFRGITGRNGESPVERVKLVYTGDLKLVTNTAFENMKLEARKYNSKTKQYDNYKSTVNVNGKVLTMINTAAEFTSLTGNGIKSVVNVTDSDIAVDKAFSNIGYLNMDSSNLIAVQNIAVTDTLTMESSVIDAGTQVSLKNVVTNDADNIIAYGGNSKNNILNISGNISSENDADTTVKVERIENNESGEEVEISETVTVRKNAIQIKPKALEPDKYQQDALLCNAAKAGAGWFVVGTMWETENQMMNRVISHGTYKKGNEIRCGEITDNVRLYSCDEREGNYVWESSFETLQEAFTEIDKIALNHKYYYVQIVKDTKGEVTYADKNLTFPSKAMEVIIGGGSVYMKDNLTLKCNTAFVNSVLVPEKEATLSIGKFEFLLEDCLIGENDSSVGFKKITGSGVNATSKLTLDNTSLLVNGEVSGIGTLVYADTQEEITQFRLLRGVTVYPELTANGKIAVGNIELQTDGHLTGYTTVTRNKEPKVTAVTPQITISGEVISTDNEYILYLDLQEVVSKVYVQLDFNKDDMKDMLTAGVKMAKADKVTYPNIKAKQCADSNLVKSGGYMMYFEGGHGVELSYKNTMEQTVTISCRTFADAVTEINTQKTKRDYTITLLAANTDISGANQNGSKEVPKALSMPNKNYVETLTIQADKEAENPVEMGFINNITLTGDVILKDIDFVQMIKSGSQYVRADELKDDYPAAVTLNVSGYHLTLKGSNTFNTPLVLNGGNKGKLVFDREGTITTLTNDYDIIPNLEADIIENVIFGTINGFDKVEVDGCNVTLKEYRTSGTSNKYTASNNKITTLNVREDGEGTGIVTVVGQNAKGSLNVTTLNNDNGQILVDGKVQLKDVVVEGTQEPTIKADLDFNITGKYVNYSDNTVLITRLKGAGKAPYLNISGTLERGADTESITVKILPESTAATGREEPVKLITEGKTSAVLLTAKNAAARDFKPHSRNYEGGEYDADNTSGYMMFKSGSNICVYDGESVAIGVYEGTVITENTLAGYFPSMKDATSFVNSLKNANQDYTYVLMEQNGSVASPTTISIPSYAKQIVLTSLENCEDIQKTIYFSGNITLSTKLVIEDVILAPIKNKAGTSFSISTGKYDLELKDTVISGELQKMELSNISGNGKQTVILDTDNLLVAGNISNTSKLIVKDNVTVNGTFKVTELQMENAARSGDDTEAVTLSVKGAITVDGLSNYGSKQNVLEFTRTTRNVSNLTINKQITNESALILLKQSDAGVVTALDKAGLQAVLTDAKKFAVMPQASTNSFVIEAKVNTAQGIDSYNSNPAENNILIPVKANKGIYLADSTLTEDVVTLTREVNEGSRTITNCLDYAQAINEINTISDAGSDYAIELHSYAETSGYVDTNVTDKNSYGPFALPGSNKKKSLIVKNADEDQKAKFTFTGNISGYGNVTIQDVELTPVKNGSDSSAADVSVKVTEDKTTQEPRLTFKNVSTKTTSAVTISDKGFVTGISGTKNKTDVVFENCDNFIMKSGITNIDEVILVNTKLFTVGASTVNAIHVENTGQMQDVSSWDSIGKLNVNDIYMPAGVHASYIGAKQDKNGKPEFVLNNEVKQGTLLCKVYGKDTTITDADEIFAAASGVKFEKEPDKYCGIMLVSAKKASADRIRAYVFRNADTDGNIVENTEQITKDNLISYKTDVYVVNGNKENMAVRITERENSESGDVISTFYAESLDGAVTTINHKADLNSYYVIQFMKEGTKENPAIIKTTKNGTAYGALTLPTKAAGLTIRGYEDVRATAGGDVTEPGTVIKYTGTLKASCDVKFENILLTEGSAVSKPVDNNDFTEKGVITPVPSANVTITFDEKVFTVSDETKQQPTVNDTLCIASVNSSKGDLVLNGTQAVSEGNIVIRDLTVENGAVLDTTGKVTIANLYADENRDNKVAAIGAMNIVAIGKTEDIIGNVNLQTGFTKTKKSSDKPQTQLTISGEITDTNVVICPQIYNLNTGEYGDITERELLLLCMNSDAKPENYKKLANITKASMQNITVLGKDMEAGFAAYDNAYNEDETQVYLYKYEKGLYLTDVGPLVKVTGYEAPEENTEAYRDEDARYQAEFLTWDQAVKEIDAIGNTKRYYKIELPKNIGASMDEMEVTSPIGTVSMPSKAAEVKITSEDGETNGIFFTGTTITLKCPTVMENVGFTCVKKYGKGIETYYDTVNYTMNVGNFKLTQQNMVTKFGGMDTTPYTITGSSKGVFELLSGAKKGQSFAAVKSLDKLIVKHNGETADGSGYENFVLDCSGDISVKNLTVENCTVEAKNITVSALTELDEASLQSGTSAANDGKLTLKDIRLADRGNAFTAEQNKSGATQIVINGTVTAAEDAKANALEEGAITLKLYYNNYTKKLFWWVVDESVPSKPVQLYDGMVLCIAQKADAKLFVPVYTVEANEEMGLHRIDGMGSKHVGYGMYKSGKNICYGKAQ